MPDEIDVTNSDGLDRLLARVAAERPDLITVDMTGTNFCDSSGIHALARAHRLAAANGGELRLAVGASPSARILQLTGLDQVLAVFADVQQSLATSRDAPARTRPDFARSFPVWGMLSNGRGRQRCLRRATGGARGCCEQSAHD